MVGSTTSTKSLLSVLTTSKLNPVVPLTAGVGVVVRVRGVVLV